MCGAKAAQIDEFARLRSTRRTQNVTDPLKEAAMSSQPKTVYLKLCFLMIAQASLVGAVRAIQPSDCQPGHMDSTCAKAVDKDPEHEPPPPPPPPPPNSFPLAGIPASGYSYWGYDFSSADIDQFDNPRFINRSGRSLILTLSFDIPNPPCGGGCLPGVEFYFDQDVHKRDPRLQVSGNTAKAVVPLKPGDRYAFIIGLWQAHNPAIAVTLPDGTAISPDLAGLSVRPDTSSWVAGTQTKCSCENGEQLDCNRGDHYTNGLSGMWYQTMGLSRFNAWTNCRREGT
jgi:hypothetical protein